MSYTADRSLQVRIEDPLSRVRFSGKLAYRSHEREAYVDVIESTLTDKLNETRFQNCAIVVQIVDTPLADQPELDYSKLRITDIPLLERITVAGDYYYQLKFVIKIKQYLYLPEFGEFKSRILIENLTDHILTEIRDYLMMPELLYIRKY